MCGRRHPTTKPHHKLYAFPVKVTNSIPCSLVVRIFGFHPNDRGSNPRREKLQPRHRLSAHEAALGLSCYTDHTTILRLWCSQYAGAPARCVVFTARCVVFTARCPARWGHHNLRIVVCAILLRKGRSRGGCSVPP